MIVALLAGVFLLILAVSVTVYYWWLRRLRSVVAAPKNKDSLLKKECRVILDSYKHLEVARNHLSLFEKLGELLTIYTLQMFFIIVNICIFILQEKDTLGQFIERKPVVS